MTKASVEYSMTGEIIGKTLVEYLMFYKYFDAKDQHKSSAMYIGLMRFVGSVQGKEGSFVMEDHGYILRVAEQVQLCTLLPGQGSGRT